MPLGPVDEWIERSIEWSGEWGQTGQSLSQEEHHVDRCHDDLHDRVGSGHLYERPKSEMELVLVDDRDRHERRSRTDRRDVTA